ncbi:MAG: hypothetical protein MR227_02835 [Firmicutes bacterium]|nr:hypothetical protein [Bacillota bacterium]
MNVIVSNKYKEIIDTVNIEVIKKIEGEYSAEELGNAFKNFYFQRMILDITAIKDYKDIDNIRKLSVMIDMDKVILLLDDSEESSDPKYLSKLVSMKIYNFTKNAEGILYLYNHPNSYRDVAYIQQIEDVKMNVSDSTTTSEGTVIIKENHGARVIGIKNVTKQSGSTTLAYMMKKKLSEKYKAMAIEIDKNDFMYFNEQNMISVKASDLGNTIQKNRDIAEVIIVDLNNSNLFDLCDDVLYLVEPSVIKLNKLMLIDRASLTKLKNKKVVLNQSLLEPKDILDFEYEAKVKVFYNLAPLDERDKVNRPLLAFLIKLGFDRMVDNVDNERRKILGLF